MSVPTTLFWDCLAVIGAFIVPEWLVASVLYPVAFAIQTRLKGDAGSTEGVDLLIADLMLVTALYKLVLKGCLETDFAKRVRNAFVPGFAAFISVMCLSIPIALFRFGSEAAARAVISLLRFLGMQVGGFVVLLLAIRTRRQADAARRCLYLLGWLAAASIYVDVLLAPFGLRLGEVNESLTGARYQGVLGDQVKIFLVPFCLVEVASRRWARAVFFATAMLATGGREGIIALILGLVVLLAVESQRNRTTKAIITCCGVAVAAWAALWAGVGDLVERLTAWSEDSSLLIRVAAHEVAWRMAVDNPLLGVGYGGYRTSVEQYADAHHAMQLGALSEPYSQLWRAVLDGGVFGAAAFVWMMVDFARLLRRSSGLVAGQLERFLRAGYAFVITLGLLSPILAWFLPAALTSYWLLQAVGLGLAVVRVYAHESLEGFQRGQPHGVGPALRAAGD